jgi:hypothetical protein
MKRHFHRVLALASIALLTSQVFIAQAAPVRSPSVRAAARLKHNPPAGWIRHYLPDDRYKILGGTWKYVSTELDRFYYPAWAPEMLRQSANRVIGFASAQDAEEAGYLPGGGYAGVDPGFDRANATRVVAQRAAARRIVLADGRSTAVLPNGWQHIGNSQNQQGADSQFDMIISPDQKSMVMVMKTQVPNVPAGTDVGALLRSGKLNQVFQSARSAGPINSQVDSLMGGVKTRPAIVGGLRGVSMNMAFSSFAPASMRAELARNKTQMLMAGRGKTMYMIVGGYEGRPSAGYNTVMRSIRFR